MNKIELPYMKTMVMKTMVMKTRDLYHNRPVKSVLWHVRSRHLSEIGTVMLKK